MLYVNDPSVVVGKHQNLLKEINAQWCYKHNIKLARRLSGGGTVFQDSGNINFSFIKNSPNPEKLNYQKFTYPIVDALVSMDLDVQYSDRNDILLKGSKISGNAMHISKNRALCHGTLLFNSDLKDLSSSLKNKTDHYIDKSINSVPSPVINISEFLTESLTKDIFIEKLFQCVIATLESPKVHPLINTEINEIDKLVKEKYSAWDWIYGYSPKYLFRNQLNLNNEIVEIELVVEKGIIIGINSNNKDIKNLLSKYLVNVKHDYSSIKEICMYKEFSGHFPDNSEDNFCCLFI